eukprot:5842492-Pleurochrysis_carterae.AAC.2
MQAHAAMRNWSKLPDANSLSMECHRAAWIKKASCRHTEEILERGRLPISRRASIAASPDGPAFFVEVMDQVPLPSHFAVGRAHLGQCAVERDTAVTMLGTCGASSLLHLANVKLVSV